MKPFQFVLILSLFAKRTTNRLHEAYYKNNTITIRETWPPKWAAVSTKTLQRCFAIKRENPSTGQTLRRWVPKRGLKYVL